MSGEASSLCIPCQALPTSLSSGQQSRQNLAGNTPAPFFYFIFVTFRVSYLKKKYVQYPRAGVRNLRAVFILERYCMHRRPGDLNVSEGNGPRGAINYATLFEVLPWVLSANARSMYILNALVWQGKISESCANTFVS